MAGKGPNPTPTAVLRDRGSPRAKRRAREARPQTGSPDKPMWMNDCAKEVWDQVLAAWGATPSLLTKADRNALARYSRMMSRYIECEKVIDSLGPSGLTSQAADEADKLADRLLRLEQHFGLTPSARVGLATVEKQEPKQSGKGRFFKK